MLAITYNPATMIFISSEKYPQVEVKSGTLSVKNTTSEFQRSGYFTRITIYVICVLAFQTFIVILGISLMITALVLIGIVLKSILCSCHKRVSRLIKGLGKFALVAIPLWILQENFLRMIVNIFIESNYLSGKYGEERRDLQYSSLEFIMFSLSIFLFLVFTIV